MSSLFTTTTGAKMGGSFGKERFVPFYLQFVPGYVVDVVTSMHSLKAGNSLRNVNSIIAMPHIKKKNEQKSMISEERRYIPLFRGIVDVPAKGDPVLLCTIGKINYYLGPLNTQNDVNFNEDNIMSLLPLQDTWTWSENNVDIILNNENNEVKKKKILMFLKKLVK